MNNRKVSFHLFGSCHLGNSKGFRSYVPETGTKDQPRFHIHRINQSGVENIYFFNFRSFPGGSVVKNLPANAGDTDPIADLERSTTKIPLVVTEQLSPCSTTIEPVL